MILDILAYAILITFTLYILIRFIISVVEDYKFRQVLVVFSIMCLLVWAMSRISG